MSNLFKKMYLVNKLIAVIQAISQPFPFGDSERARQWLLDLLRAGEPLTDETDSPLDDATIVLLIELVESDAWDKVYDYASYVLGLFRMQVGAANDEAIEAGRVPFARFGVRRERIEEAVLELVESYGDDFTEQPAEEQAHMVADALIGGRRGRRLFARRAGAERDWKAFFDAFVALLEKLVPLILELIVIFV